VLLSAPLEQLRVCLLEAENDKVGGHRDDALEKDLANPLLAQQNTFHQPIQRPAFLHRFSLAEGLNDHCGYL
jgi:hypothetical protein